MEVPRHGVERFGDDPPERHDHLLLSFEALTVGLVGRKARWGWGKARVASSWLLLTSWRRGPVLRVPAASLRGPTSKGSVCLPAGLYHEVDAHDCHEREDRSAEVRVIERAPNRDTNEHKDEGHE